MLIGWNIIFKHMSGSIWLASGWQYHMVEKGLLQGILSYWGGF